jgi:hypothetical protein
MRLSVLIVVAGLSCGAVHAAPQEKLALDVQGLYLKPQRSFLPCGDEEADAE